MSKTKPNVWLHEFGGDYGWKTEFKDLALKHFDIVTTAELEATPELGTEIKGALLMNLAMLKKLMPLMPNLKAVANHGVGYNHINVQDFRSQGISVSNTPDILNAGVSEMAIALMLTSSRKIYQGIQLAMGATQPVFKLNDLGHDVSYKTLGIVGMGGIGFNLARKAKAFDMDILYHNRTRRLKEEEEIGATYFSSLHDMLPQCDYVMIVCPLTPQTENMFSENEFKLMKKSATIINIARGRIIDQDALVHALQTQEIRAAALDVTTPEPLPRNHPLLQLTNVIITPHYGSATVETRQEMCQCMVDNLKAVLIDGKDRMPNQVN